MIATILPGNSNFHAVGYNERKVAKGVARMLEMQNFGTLGTFGKPTPEELVTYLQEYTSRNTRIEKAQFHVAFSCKGHDHERRRSQEVIDRILGNDRKEEVNKDLDAAKQYTFSSFAQFKAVMTSMGYEVYQKNGTIFVKHGGKVQEKFPISSIEALYKKRDYNRARNRQLRSNLKKYRDVSSNKEELQKELKTKFGIDIVFFGKKDAAYGYILVDHANKTVIHGARVLAIDELLDFATPEQRFDRIEDFIDQLLTLNPKITQGEIFQKLKKHHAYIKKGVIYFNGESRRLKPFMAEAIDRNNRIELVEKFQPTTEAERDLLCKIYKVNRPDLVSLSSERAASHIDAINRLKEIFDDETISSVRSALREEGFIIRQEEDATYAINFKNHIIINLSEEGFNLERLKRKPTKQQQPHPKHSANKPLSRYNKMRDHGEGSHSEKREWEVGQKGGYDDIDDGHSLKR